MFNPDACSRTFPCEGSEWGYEAEQEEPSEQEDAEEDVDDKVILGTYTVMAQWTLLIEMWMLTLKRIWRQGCESQ